MTRLPCEGRNKTRLIPALGAKGASIFHEKLARHAIGRASSYCISSRSYLSVRIEGGTAIEGKTWLGADALDCREQGSGDLGEKMLSAAAGAFSEGATKVIIIGTDCPSIDETVLENAFASLASNHLVFGPAEDGGYYLVGMTRPIREIFENIPWGGSEVLERSVASARHVGIDPHLLASLSDVDFPEDLPAAEVALDGGRTVSVIIPTLNEAENIAKLLHYLKSNSPHEIIIADGGSNDGTREIAAAAGANVVSAPRGRALQMNHGAAVATGEFLLFLHADTVPPENFPEIMQKILNQPGTAAGAFRFKLDDEIRASALIEALVHLRCRFFHTPYGDQGIFLRRHTFEAVEKFPEWKILEDLGLIRNLKRHGKIRIPKETAVTSSRRWLSGGLIGTFLKHQLILAAYSIRIPPRLLARIRF